LASQEQDIEDLESEIESQEEEAILKDNPYGVNWLRFTSHTIAERLLDLFFKDQLVFTGREKSRSVYRFNGFYWRQLDSDCSEILQRFPDLFQYYKTGLDSIRPLVTKTIYDKYCRQLLRLDTPGFKRSVVKSLKDIIYRSESNIQWNNHRHLFAFRDSIYNLETGQFIPPSPDQFINYTTGYNYQDSNFSPNDLTQARDKILTFLSAIMGNDEEMVTYLLKVLASFLVQCNDEERAYFFIGAGRNGKVKIIFYLKLIIIYKGNY
jgi:hypothetical protein